MARAADPLITLTTDFGARDPYVAAMKGVLLSRCPNARICDLSHEITAHQIVEAALFVEAAAPHFPPRTIHVIVVDPGVGSARSSVAVAAGGQRFVCPDNGLLSLYMQTHPASAIHRIENPACRASDPAPTFHGRDIFAPTAAWLAAGHAIEDVGPAMTELVSLPKVQPETQGDGTIHGEIIHIDRFGNCISNIHHEHVPDKEYYKVQIGAVSLPRIESTYAAVPQGAVLALFGSSGRLEIARREGSAQRELGLEPGTPLTLYKP
ncbi:MAG: SAM-dependent chlorinase/fluorinase [Candidatus Hydrogenedentes bacterium]|nr:SAM-dependent chlorinase/fluorinase [Candidatus Hydrogenedentota bacterium]